jgi:serine/threonine-protein kinase
MTDAFGRYELLGRLGAGGMAEVFVARCGDVQGMQSLLAVKRILPHLADDEAFVSLFRREAQISLRLRHRAIARVFEVGLVGTAWFLAMELVPGESLSHLWRAEIASALHHAHGLMDGGSPLEVIHRDVSPQNLLLGFDGAPKLIDFGVARCVRLSDATRTGTVRGKLSYASPEQIGARTLDGRSDLFSLAVVLHEWLNGTPLFRRDSEAATIQAVLEAPVRPSSTAPRLGAVLARALERSPDKRYADGEAMADALLEAVGGRPAAPERLLAAHLAARFPERKKRWEAIIAGGEINLANVEAVMQSRSETVRHASTTSSLTLPSMAASTKQLRSADARSPTARRTRLQALGALAGMIGFGGLLVGALTRHPPHPGEGPLVSTARAPAKAVTSSPLDTTAGSARNPGDGTEVAGSPTPAPTPLASAARAQRGDTTSTAILLPTREERRARDPGAPPGDGSSPGVGARAATIQARHSDESLDDAPGKRTSRRRRPRRTVSLEGRTVATPSSSRLALPRNAAPSRSHVEADRAVVNELEPSPYAKP